MKLSTALIFASAFSMASASTTIRSPAARASLLSKSRRLDQNAEEDMYSFLSNYDIKLIGCANGQSWQDPADGTTEYSTVVFRLCPADSCDSSSAGGCKKGYGDFSVGINTYVQAWLEDKRESMQQDDNFKIEDYGECREYNFEQQADDADQIVYYVGPVCGSVTPGIMLGLFTDNTCQTVSSKSFEELSNGWTLPYSTSGLVSQTCESCAGYDDQGAYAVSDMCTNLYENSGKCMTGMESTNSNGVDETGCSTIQTLMPAKKSGGAGAAVGWTIFALLIVGGAAYGYTKWWLKKKQSSSLASDGN